MLLPADSCRSFLFFFRVYPPALGQVSSLLNKVSFSLKYFAKTLLWIVLLNSLCVLSVCYEENGSLIS